MALTMMLGLASCSTDNDNSETSSTGNVIVKVNTADLYEELGITNYMLQILAKNDLAIEGKVLIYDAEGNLINELTQTTKQLDPLSFEVNNLPKGSYTLVAYQSINESDVWELVDKEKLSTVKLYAGTKHLYFYRALGLVSKTVTVNSGAIEEELTPKATGAMVDLRMDRTEGFTNLMSLSIFRHANGIFLDPARSEEDRLEYDPAENLSAGYIFENSDRMIYFVLAAGDMSTVLWYFSPDDNMFFSEWWNQPISLKPGAQIVYYYDKNPQLLYKAYVGPADGFEAWQAKKKDGRYALKPFAPYGISKDEVDKYMDVSGVYHTYIRTAQQDGYYYLLYYLDCRGKFKTEFVVDENKGLIGTYYTYENDDITLSQVEDEFTKMGYQFTQEKPNGETGKIHIFQSPNAEEVLLTHYVPEKKGWEVFFGLESETEYARMMQWDQRD